MFSLEEIPHRVRLILGFAVGHFRGLRGHQSIREITPLEIRNTTHIPLLPRLRCSRTSSVTLRRFRRNYPPKYDCNFPRIERRACYTVYSLIVC